MDAVSMQALYHIQAFESAAIPDVDRWSVSYLTRRNDAAVAMRHRTADDWLVVLDVVPLLADAGIEKHDDASNEKDYLLIDYSRLLFVFVHGASAQGSLPANCVL